MSIVINYGGIKSLEARNSLDKPKYSAFVIDYRGSCEEKKILQCNLRSPSEDSQYQVNYDVKQVSKTLECWSSINDCENLSKMKVANGIVNGCVSSSSDVLQDGSSVNQGANNVRSSATNGGDVYQLHVSIKDGSEGASRNCDGARNSDRPYQSSVLSSTAVENSSLTSSKSQSDLASSTVAELKHVDPIKSSCSTNSPVSSSPSIHVVLPSNSAMLSSPSTSQAQAVVTAFLAPVQASPKKSTGPISPSVCNSSRTKSPQQSVVHSASLSGPKILVAQPSSVVNGQIRQNIVPVTSAGTTILLAQGSSMLSVPAKTATSSTGVNVGNCLNLNSVGPRKYVATSGNTLTLPYTQANIVRTTLPIGTPVNLTSSVPPTSSHHSLPLTFSISSTKTITTSSTCASNTLSSGSTPTKHSPFTLHNNGNKVVVNLKQRISQHSNSTLHSTYSSSSHRYYGLPYQDHNYGAPPPPTPPQSPSPPPPATVMSPMQQVIESSIISVDENSNTSIASSVSTETALSTNGDDIEVTVSSTVNDFSHEVKAPPPTDEQSITRCICEFNHDDEYMICCDKCLVWQHLDCMGINRNDIPDTYLCERCLPRKMDIRRAKSLQSKKRGKLRPVNCSSDTSSADESKDENRQKQTTAKTRKLKKKDQKPEKIILKKKNKKVKEMKIDVKKANMRRRKKSRSNSFNCMDEETRDNWDGGMLREWIDKYEEALINQYTPEVQLLVSSLQLNGKNEALVKSATKQLRAQLCRVAWNASSGRRLVSTNDIESNQLIIEYRGKFLSLSQFKDQNPVFSNKSYPFILFYSPGVDEEDVCVDAREYGNTARFVRRSCTPNAEVRHVVENGLLHLYLFSLCKISKEEEITIPFDFNYRKCVNKVECACSKEKCSVATVIVKKNGLNTFPSIEKEKKRQLRRKSDNNSVEQLREKATPVKVLRSPPPSPVKTPKKPVSPLKVTQPSNVSCDDVPSAPPPPDESFRLPESDSSESSADKKHKMTREERKMEAIMKAIERMEKTEKRRQQALERIAQKHGPDADGNEKPSFGEVKESPVKQEVADSSSSASAVISTTSPCSAPVTTSVHDETVKIDDGSITDEQKLQPSQKRKGKKRKASGTPNKRRPRTVSGSSDQSNVMSSADESGYITSFGAISTPNTPFMSSEIDSLKGSAGNICPFRFPKTKKTMMSEWLHDKSDHQPSMLSPTLPPTSPLSVKTDGFTNYPQHPLAISDYFSSSSQLCYVRNTRGGNAGINVAHLRRNSCSEKDKVTCNESNMGSAKKRWLRQVMHDEEVVNEPPPAPSSPLHSPCASPPTDTITPLKKRRLMRESMSSDLSTPSSPCVTNSPGLLSERLAELSESKPDKVADVDKKPSLDSVENGDVRLVKQELSNVADSSSTEQEKIENEIKPRAIFEEAVPAECEKVEAADEPMDMHKNVEIIHAIESNEVDQTKETTMIEIRDAQDGLHKESLPPVKKHDGDDVEEEDTRSQLLDDKPSVKTEEPLNMKTEVVENEVRLVKSEPCNHSTDGHEQDVKPSHSELAVKAESIKMEENFELETSCINATPNQNMKAEIEEKFDEDQLSRPETIKEEDVFFENKELCETMPVGKIEKHEMQDVKPSESSDAMHNVVESSPHVTPMKKKVSLSEYRLRKNLSKPCISSASSPGHSRGSSAPESTTATPDSNSTSPINLPSMPISLMTPGKSPPKLSTLPLFKSFKEEGKPKRKSFKTSFKDKLDDKKSSQEERRFDDDEQSHWNSAPTSFEKVTEQQRENLTQRLKREFGLLSEPEIASTSGAESSSDDKDASIPPPPPKPLGGRFHSYQNEPPPPPPPPRPPAPALTTQIQYHNPAYGTNSLRFPAASNAAPIYHHPLPSTFVPGQPAPSYSIPGQQSQAAAVTNYMPQVYQQQPSHPAPAVLVYPPVPAQAPYLAPANPVNQLPSNYPYGNL